MFQCHDRLRRESASPSGILHQRSHHALNGKHLSPRCNMGFVVERQRRSHMKLARPLTIGTDYPEWSAAWLRWPHDWSDVYGSRNQAKPSRQPPHIRITSSCNAIRRCRSAPSVCDTTQRPIAGYSVETSWSICSEAATTFKKVSSGRSPKRRNMIALSPCPDSSAVLAASSNSSRTTGPSSGPSD